MKKIAATAFLLLGLGCLFPLPATFAQEGKPVEYSNPAAELKSGVTVAGIRVERTPAFFQQVLAAAKPAKRGQFETPEEYAQRAKNPIIPGQVYYFVVQRDFPDAALPGKSVKDPFEYDLNTGRLNILAGVDVIQEEKTRGAVKTVPFCIYSEVKDMGEYDASNTFGAKRRVYRGLTSRFLFYITNTKQFTSANVDFRHDRFAAALNLPREQAEALSKSAVIIIGVRPISLKSAAARVTRDSPTLDNPLDMTNITDYIEAELVEVRLVDGATGKTLATVSADTSKK